MKSIMIAVALIAVAWDASADTHLMPLDLGVAYRRNAEANDWFKGLGENDRIIVEYDVFPTFREAAFLGIIQFDKDKSFALYSVTRSYGQNGPTVIQVPVPAEYVTTLADKLNQLIRQDTHFDPSESMNPQPMDASDYLFKSRLAVAEAYNANEGGVPRRLVTAFKVIAKLANTAATDSATRQKLMNDSLSALSED